MEATRTTVSISIDLALASTTAFDMLLEELAVAFAQGGMDFEAGMNGRLTVGEFEVGSIVAWKPGELIRLQWHQADWNPEEVTEIEVRLEPIDEGTRVTLSHRGWGGLIGDPAELAGWFASAMAAPLLQAMAPAGFGNWLTDRRARRARRRVPSTATRSTTIPTSMRSWRNCTSLLTIISSKWAVEAVRFSRRHSRADAVRQRLTTAWTWYDSHRR